MTNYVTLGGILFDIGLSKFEIYYIYVLYLVFYCRYGYIQQ